MDAIDSNDMTQRLIYSIVAQKLMVEQFVESGAYVLCK
jgi:hypothetical protein